jgi:hypothetical protein
MADQLTMKRQKRAFHYSDLFPRYGADYLSPHKLPERWLLLLISDAVDSL